MQHLQWRVNFFVDAMKTAKRVEHAFLARQDCFQQAEKIFEHEAQCSNVFLTVENL